MQLQNQLQNLDIVLDSAERHILELGGAPIVDQGERFLAGAADVTAAILAACAAIAAHDDDALPVLWSSLDALLVDAVN
jgi:hypothetical protein